MKNMAASILRHLRNFATARGDDSGTLGVFGAGAQEEMIMPPVNDASIRISARIPAGMCNRLEEAAELSGVTLNQFVLQSALGEAERLLDRETTIRLSRESAKRVFDLLDPPPRANKRLREALKLHSDLIRGA